MPSGGEKPTRAMRVETLLYTPLFFNDALSDDSEVVQNGDNSGKRTDSGVLGGE